MVNKSDFHANHAGPIHRQAAGRHGTGRQSRTSDSRGNFKWNQPAECIVLVGHNAAEQSTVLWMRILAAKAGPLRSKVIVVDPRRTLTVSTGADLHLQLRPEPTCARNTTALSLTVSTALKVTRSWRSVKGRRTVPSVGRAGSVPRTPRRSSHGVRTVVGSPVLCGVEDMEAIRHVSVSPCTPVLAVRSAPGAGSLPGGGVLPPPQAAVTTTANNAVGPTDTLIIGPPDRTTALATRVRSRRVEPSRHTSVC
jgi:Molybdopterin oxidoreductase